MSRFKVGDIVERVESSQNPHKYGEVGRQYEVLSVEGSNIEVIKGYDGAFTGYFKLVKEAKPKDSVGGPSSYYDMPFQDWDTSNDMMEHLAVNKWKDHSIHLKDIFKGLCRWGEKDGTTVEYDTRKIIYYGLRVYRMMVGKEGVQKYLKELAEDKQFQEKDDE